MSCISEKEKRKTGKRKGEKRGPASRSGGGVDFGAVLSSAQDLVQSGGHVVRPGGGAVVPLQVFAWERRPPGGARGEEEEQEGRGREGRSKKAKREREVRAEQRTGEINEYRCRN